MVDINKIITEEVKKNNKDNKEKEAKGEKKIELETISVSDLKKLLNGGQ